MVYTLKECVVIGSGISGLAVMIFLLLEIHRFLFIDKFLFMNRLLLDGTLAKSKHFYFYIMNEIFHIYINI